MYGQAEVTRTFSDKGIINKSFSANLIKIPISPVELKICKSKKNGVFGYSRISMQKPVKVG
jgi:hypothetical protein